MQAALVYAEHPLSRWVCWKGVGEVGKGQMEHRGEVHQRHVACQKSSEGTEEEGGVRPEWEAAGGRAGWEDGDGGRGEVRGER